MPKDRRPQGQFKLVPGAGQDFIEANIAEICRSGAHIVGVLAMDVRVAILRRLAWLERLNERRSGQTTDNVGALLAYLTKQGYEESDSNISVHLRVLQAAELVKGVKMGTEIFYTLNGPGISNAILLLMACFGLMAADLRQALTVLQPEEFHSWSSRVKYLYQQLDGSVLYVYMFRQLALGTKTGKELISTSTSVFPVDSQRVAAYIQKLLRANIIAATSFPLVNTS